MKRTYNTTCAEPDDRDPRGLDWSERRARAVVPFEVVDGLPVNPVQDLATLPAGRGGLWHWGEAVAADAVVLAITADDRRYLLLVERADGHGWALPGGMLDPGETPCVAAARELGEETGLDLEPVVFMMLPGRGVPDPRAGAHSWMVTVPGVVGLHCERLPRVAGLDDARAAVWFPAASYEELTAALEGVLFAAHVDLVREVLAL